MRSWRDLAEVTTIDAAPFSSFAFGELYVIHRIPIDFRI
jgi:hypothetical protein